MSKDLRKLLHEYKYNNKRAFCKVLAQIVSNNIDNTGSNYIIVPLPPSSKHRRQEDMIIFLILCDIYLK